MFAIPKAATYGGKDSWQISPDFLKDVVKQARMQGMDDVYEEMVDDIIIVLEKMGHVILKN